MNVVIDRAEHVLSGASRKLAGAARLIARREVLTAEDVASLNRIIANARETLDEVEAETGADRTGLTVPSAGWETRNDIAAERAASTGAA